TMCAPTTLMHSSPTPVEPAAPISLSTYNPQPMSGESPTRPGILKARPLVVVMPERSPFASSARQLIVPQALSGLIPSSRHKSSRLLEDAFGGGAYAGTSSRFGGPQSS